MKNKIISRNKSYGIYEIHLDHDTIDNVALQSSVLTNTIQFSHANKFPPRARFLNPAVPYAARRE